MRFSVAATAGLWMASSLTAQADVTPQQVWDDWQAYLGSVGYEIAGSERLAGDTLEITDVVMRADIPIEDGLDGAFEVAIPFLRFVQVADGAVTVEIPDTMPLVYSDPTTTLRLDYTQEAFDLRVTGDADEMAYSYEAETLGLSLVELEVDGQAILREDARFELSLGPVSGQTETAFQTETRISQQAVTLGDIVYSTAFRDPEGSGSLSLSGRIAGVAAEAEAAIPDAVDLSQMAAAVSLGFSARGESRHNGATLEFSVVEPSGTTSGRTESVGGRTAFTMSADGLGYDIDTEALSLMLVSPELPFPVNAAFEATRLSVAVPVEASETSQEARLAVALEGFTMSELLWNVFDPAAMLPRDPATMQIDLVAMVRPLVSLFDAEGLEKLGASGEAPATLEALTLETVTLDMAGARLEGQGAFRFDNSDLETFPGMPRPAGTLDLSVAGHNGLIDTLIAMGVLTNEDAMGARMMLSMMTVPGAEPDSATSTIEITDEGQIFANGQRLQ